MRQVDWGLSFALGSLVSPVWSLLWRGWLPAVTSKLLDLIFFFWCAGVNFPVHTTFNAYGKAKK